MIRGLVSGLLIGGMGIWAGCATTAPPLSILYSPSVETRGGSGELILRAAHGHTSLSGSNNVRWVIGKSKDSEGRVTGEILSSSSAEDMVLDALKRELTVAGYRVEWDDYLPSNVPKGLDLAAIQLEIEETVGIPKVEATGTVKVSVDVWKDGKKIRRLTYKSTVSDVAVIDRRRLSRDMVEKGLHGVMNQAVPEIIAALERKPQHRNIQ